MELKSPDKISLGQSDDFHRDKLIKEIDDHSREINSLGVKISTLENKFSTNEKIADTLEQVLSRDTKIQDKLAIIFIKLLNTDSQVKQIISEVIKKSDRDYLGMILKRLGILTWTLSSSAIGIIIGVILRDHITLH